MFRARNIFSGQHPPSLACRSAEAGLRDIGKGAQSGNGLPGVLQELDTAARAGGGVKRPVLRDIPRILRDIRMTGRCLPEGRLAVVKRIA